MTDFSSLSSRLAGVDWHEANAEKNRARENVSRNESEELFFNSPVMLADDAAHSDRERRYLVLGRSNAERLLAVIFTVPSDLVRVMLPVRCGRVVTTTPEEVNA